MGLYSAELVSCVSILGSVHSDPRDFSRIIWYGQVFFRAIRSHVLVGEFTEKLVVKLDNSENTGPMLVM
jgi:hypothetical protein